MREIIKTTVSLVASVAFVAIGFAVLGIISRFAVEAFTWGYQLI